MSKAADVKAFAAELRPHIAADIDRAEILKAMAKAARDKGIDWAQLKALVKAQELDAREGSDRRVAAIIDKADFAAAYADMLGFASKMNNKGKSCSSASQNATDRDPRIIRPAPVGEISIAVADAGDLPAFLDRRPS